MANLFTHLARGDTMLSVCLSGAASLTSVLTVPLFVNVALRLFSSGHSLVRLPVSDTALGLFVVSTLPVAGGMVLRWRRPAAARAVEGRVGAFGLAVASAVIVSSVWSMKEDVLPALARAGGPALLLNWLSVGAAWGVAALAGLGLRQRISVGLECGLQNFALAAFVALTQLADPRLLLPGIAYGLTMYLSAAGVVWLARRATAAGPGLEWERDESMHPVDTKPSLRADRSAGSRAGD
jgi:BASS family bile acid:Na+ symporter